MGQALTERGFLGGRGELSAAGGHSQVWVLVSWPRRPALRGRQATGDAGAAPQEGGDLYLPAAGRPRDEGHAAAPLAT